MNIHVDNVSETLLHSEQPKLYEVLAVLSAIGLNVGITKYSSGQPLMEKNILCEFCIYNLFQNIWVLRKCVLNVYLLLEYSRTSVVRTLMAHLPRLFRTCS